MKKKKTRKEKSPKNAGDTKIAPPAVQYLPPSHFPPFFLFLFCFFASAATEQLPTPSSFFSFSLFLFLLSSPARVPPSRLNFSFFFLVRKSDRMNKNRKERNSIVWKGSGTGRNIKNSRSSCCDLSQPSCSCGRRKRNGLSGPILLLLRCSWLVFPLRGGRKREEVRENHRAQPRKRNAGDTKIAPLLCCDAISAPNPLVSFLSSARAVTLILPPHPPSPPPS